VIPNLLVDGIPRAIASSPALKVYFVNLMSQPGETNHFRASDHVAAILRHAGRSYSRSLIDVCVVNTRPVAARVLNRYRASDAKPVETDLANLERLGLRVIAADLLGMHGVPQKARHDPAAIGAIALDLARQGHAKLRLTS